MKKDSKRQIKNYDKTYYFQYEYYGLLKKKGKLRIDVKRFLNHCYVNDEIKTELKKPRVTVYFIPRHKKRYDYNINQFLDELNSIKNEWNNEIKKAMSSVLTPKQAENNEYSGYWVQTGILEPDEVSMVAMMKGLKRKYSYHKIMLSFYAQFIHQFASRIEAITITVLIKNGFTVEHFNRTEFMSLFNGATKKKLEDLNSYIYYDQFYKVWNFLKHNSISAYDKLKESYPELLNKDEDDKVYEYKNGDLAIYYLSLNEDLINSFFTGLEKFFKELCIILFSEVIEEASWNYEDYFYRLANDEIELIDNPLGIPDFL